MPLEFRLIQTAQLVRWKGEIHYPEADRVIDVVEKILGIPRKVKSKIKQVESKKIEDKKLKYKSRKYSADDEKDKSQLLQVEKAEIKPSISDKIETKQIDQKPKNHLGKKQEYKPKHSAFRPDSITNAPINELEEIDNAPLCVISFIIGLAIISWLFLFVKQDWNLWLGLSIPFMTLALSAFVFARRSIRLLFVMVVLNAILGLYIFFSGVFGW